MQWHLGISEGNAHPPDVACARYLSRVPAPTADSHGQRLHTSDVVVMATRQTTTKTCGKQMMAR